MPSEEIPKKILGLSAEEIKARLAEIDKTSTKKAQADSILNEVRDRARRDAMGLDLDFDILPLIQESRVVKRGMEIVPGKFYVDMSSLAAGEDMLAEHLVDSVYPSLNKLTKVYDNAKLKAVLAMGIIRWNNREFPMPSFDPEEWGKPQWTRDMESKKILYGIILKLDSKFVDLLKSIHDNLAFADVLISDDAKKNSAGQASAGESGGSAASTSSPPTTPS